MTGELENKLETAIWTAKTLFDRQKVSGSSANISFIHEGNIYISASGTCFGRLTQESFSCVAPDGTRKGPAPSKELPLHRIYYGKSDKIQAVIHTHSFYSTLWSCLPHSDSTDVIPEYTPYLRMKLGTVGLVPYAKPGSEDLFALFKEAVGKSDGFLLANHGSVVGGKDMLSAFYIIEELEESARIAWELHNEKGLIIRQD